MTTRGGPPMRRSLAWLMTAALVVFVACGGGGGDRDLGPPVEQPSTTAVAKTNAGHKKPARSSGARKSATTSAAAKYAGPSPPLTCLRVSRLEKAAKRARGGWSGEDPKTGRPVFIDGPYETANDARGSAASLEGVQHAAQGGLYVVSAPLTSDVGGLVDDVASCLQRSG